MKEILITNDDGFEARGINELFKALKTLKGVNVTVVAPSSEKSACAHSITCTRPLKFKKLDDNFFKLDDATPADCVHLSVQALYNKLPDLVVSGINHGANIAEDITYSGTCGGAMEAVLLGIPSLAVSQLFYNDSIDKYGFDLACELTLELVDKILNKGFPLPARHFLNLNVPAVSKKDYKGMKVVPVGEKIYFTDAQENKNPRGEHYYWLGKNTMEFDKSKNNGTDIATIFEGYASLSPLMLNLTAKDELENLKKWL